MSITQPVCVCVCVYVALVILHAMRMLRFAICGLPRSTRFSTLSHKRREFRKTLLNTKGVFWFSLRLSETFLFLRRNKRDMIKNIYWSLCKVPLILVRFYWRLNFLDRFLKNPQILNFMIIRSVGAELFLAEGRRADMTKLRVAFRNFAEAPKNEISSTWAYRNV